MSCMNPVRNFRSSSFKFRVNIILQPMPISSLQTFCLKCIYFSENPNNIWREYKFTKFHIMQFSPASHFCLPIRSKYSRHHCILKYSQYIFFPQYEDNEVSRPYEQHVKAGPHYPIGKAGTVSMAYEENFEYVFFICTIKVAAQCTYVRTGDQHCKVLLQA